MIWKSILGWVSGSVILFATVVGVSASFAFGGGPLHHYILSKVEQKAAAITGGKVDIQNFDFHLTSLSADVYGITIHGTEPSGTKPLLTVDRLYINLHLVSLFHMKFNVQELGIYHPVANLRVTKTGHSNIPSSAGGSKSGGSKQGGSSTNVFKLAVGHVLLQNGEIFYNDHKTPLYANLYYVGSDIHFNSSQDQYNGSFSYKNGKVKYASFAPMQHDLKVQFTASPSKATVSPLDVQLGGSHATVKAVMTNYSNPDVTGSYDVTLHTQDFNTKGQSTRATGDLVLTGSMNYQSTPNQPALRSVVLHGDLTSHELTLVSPQAHLPIQAIHGHYELTNGDLAAKAVDMDLLNGHLVADVNIRHLSETPTAQIHAALKRISIQAAQRALRHVSTKNIVITGNVNGTADASWTGSMNNLHARSDIAMRAALNNTASNPGRGVPIGGAIHAVYNGPRGVVTLRNTILHGPSSSITANGTVGERGSNLVVRAQTRNLHDIVALVSALSPSPAKLPAASGPATINASITGSLKRPHIDAQVAANNLAVEGTQWRTVQVSAQASPSAISIQNGNIVNARGGQMTFAGTVDLKDWSYTPSSAITATAKAQQMPVSELQQLANLKYPITGYLSANLTFHGSQLNPVGQGFVQLTKATAYQQPVQNFQAQFQANGNTVTSTLNVKLPAGSANAKATYYVERRAYDFQMTAPAIALQQLQAIEVKNVPLKGTLSASARGSGTISNPQLTATIEVPTLQVRDTTITGMRANLDVANHRAAFSVGSDVAQATVRAHGSVDLTGDYYADATLDTTRVPITPLLAAYVSSIPTGAQAQVEMHASIKGPLKDQSKLQAHLVIPTFSASYQKLQLANSGPIRADYANGVLTVQPAVLEGTDTTLHFQGQIPIQAKSSLNVSATGSVNLRLASMFTPDVKTAGIMDLDVHGSGTLKHPGLNGQIRLQKVALTTSSAPVGVQNLNGLLTVNNGKILVSQLSGESGGGQISAGGSITYAPQLSFNLALSAKSVRVLYPDGVRTVFNSNLTLAGTRQASDLTGRVLIDGLSFTPDFDLASFMNQTSTPSLPPTNPGFEDNLKLNISVQSTSELAAVSSEVSIEGNANLHIIGTAANPVITGRADLNSGEVFFMKQRYQLERGIINFVNANRTEPNVNILITTTVQQYDLSLTIVGPVEKLRTSYTSDPPLPPVDIINLIARGQTTEQQTAPGNFSANQVIAGELASQVSSRLGKFAGISSLTIDPLLGGNGVNPSARIAVQQRVTKNFIFTFSTDVTNPQAEVVQGEYQINKNWGVSATRDQYGGFAVEGKYRKTF